MATGANFEIQMHYWMHGHCNICGWDGPRRDASDNVHDDWVKHRDAEHPGATVWPGKEDWEPGRPYPGKAESNAPRLSGIIHTGDAPWEAVSTTLPKTSLRDRLRS